MLRSLLVGLLAVTGASACSGGGGDAPAVEPGKAVGKVVEITGKVTATRGTVTRDLDASSTVSGDDVITTAGDGRVTILLAHNNAKWDLGPNKREQVSTSMAWKLAKVDAPAGTVDETSTAAGRHAERSAANGESAAGAARTERAPAPTTATTGAQGAPAAADEADGTRAAPGGPPTGGGGEAPPAAQPMPSAEAPRDKGARDDRSPPRPPSPPKTAMAPAATEKPTLPPAPRDEAIGGGAMTKSATKEAVKVDPKTVAAKNDLEDRATPDDGVAPNPLAAAIEKERPALRACVVKSGRDQLAMKVRFAKGKATITLAEGSVADRACVAAVAARIKLTVDRADYSAIIAK